MLELAPPGERGVRADDLGRRWRELTGPIPEALELGFSAADLLPGEDVNVQLFGADPVQLRAAVERVKQGLRGLRGYTAYTMLPTRARAVRGIWRYPATTGAGRQRRVADAPPQPRSARHPVRPPEPFSLVAHC